MGEMKSTGKKRIKKVDRDAKESRVDAIGVASTSPVNEEWKRL